MTKKMTDKDLAREFIRLNERFFNDRVMLTDIKFAKNMPNGASACYSMENKTILVDATLRNFWTIVSMLLLHEMTHADLDARGYVGYPEDGGHGPLFQVELDRLYRAGAYDNVL